MSKNVEYYCCMHLLLRLPRQTTVIQPFAKQNILIAMPNDHIHSYEYTGMTKHDHIHLYEMRKQQTITK